MILNANFNAPTNRIGYTKTNNQITQKPNVQKQSSPNFKGGGLIGGFVSYFLADVVAIIVGVGKTDQIVRKKNLQDAKEFGLRVLKRNHKEELKGIEYQTREVVLGLDAFGKDKTAKKLSQRIKKSYEKSFNTELFMDKKETSEKKDLNTVVTNIASLEDKVDELFVKMDNQDRYTAIAKPFLDTLAKAQEKLLP